MMAFIRKHLFLLISGAVVLLGVGLLVMGNLMAAANVDRIAQVRNQCDQVSRLSGQVVTEGELKQLEHAKKQAGTLRTQVEQMAVMSSRRRLLYDRIFPRLEDPRAPRLYYERFARSYVEAIKDLLEKHLRAGTPPTEEEIERGIVNITGSSTPAAGTPGGYGLLESIPSVPGAGAASRTDSAAREEVDRERAKEIAVYATPEAFCVYNHWLPGSPVGEPAVLAQESWFTQVAYWIQEDVVLSIAQINEGSSSVFSSPIKRLIGITFGGQPPTSQPADAGVATADRPVTAAHAGLRPAIAAGRLVPQSEIFLPTYVRASQVQSSQPFATADSKRQLMGSMVDAYTVRASNELIDVVHFRVAVVLDTDHLYDFINALQGRKGAAGEQRNQITVLAIDLQPVNIAAENASGYYYGDGHFTVARLTCEYFFFSQGYANYMPKEVKDILAPPPDQSGAADFAYGS